MAISSNLSLNANYFVPKKKFILHQQPNPKNAAQFNSSAANMMLSTPNGGGSAIETTTTRNNMSAAANEARKLNKSNTHHGLVWPFLANIIPVAPSLVINRTLFYYLLPAQSSLLSSAKPHNAMMTIGKDCRAAVWHCWFGVKALLCISSCSVP